MELKAKFGKYKVKDVDQLLKDKEAAFQSEKEKLEASIKALESEKADLLKQIADYKEKESVIARVMLDATQHAKQVEDDYRHRAEESDEACRKLKEEWIGGMQSASANLAKMRAEAKQLLEEIDGQFSSLCTWADRKLTSLADAELPEPGAASLAAEISKGAGADLGDLCREMGMMKDEQ